MDWGPGGGPRQVRRAGLQGVGVLRQGSILRGAAAVGRAWPVGRVRQGPARLEVAGQRGGWPSE
eukprot:4918576-Alexandrium_andersonii.AAC.1